MHQCINDRTTFPDLADVGNGLKVVKFGAVQGCLVFNGTSWYDSDGTWYKIVLRWWNLVSKFKIGVGTKSL